MATTATHNYTQAAYFNASPPALDRPTNVFWPWVGADLCDPDRDHKLHAVPWGNDIIGDIYGYLTLARVSLNIGRNITPRAEAWMQIAVEKLLQLLDFGILPTIDDEAQAVRRLLQAGQLLSDEAGWHLYRLAWEGSGPEEKPGVYCVRERELQLLRRSREFLQLDEL
ncbi:hypothetical protein KC318_g1877 [Hortaea werneckii]|nr:hypothetical protein KC334_g6722 [Hortaea werneckii]KAI7008759.1 hypothetical protein KC355_g6807 [Hortaea werneckii]KAI7673992.1 hypothetical protein KC318_g1877 [Hortaea werneckii]